MYVVKCMYPSAVGYDADQLRDGVCIALFTLSNCLSPLWLEFQAVMLT